MLLRSWNLIFVDVRKETNHSNWASLIVLAALTAVPLHAQLIGAGRDHTLELQTSGAVRVWGDNSYGELGLGHTVDQFTPRVLGGLSGVSAVVTGEWTSFALHTNGTVKAWGANDVGQLGLGALPPQQYGGYFGTVPIFTTPQAIPGLTAVVKLSAGYGHTLAVLSNGTVKAWGGNSLGELGLGNTTDQSSPQLIAGLTGVLAVATGNQHSLAVLTNGTVKAWGNNTDGQLGLGNTPPQQYVAGMGGPYPIFVTPQTIAGLNGVIAVAAGSGHSFALLSNGTVKAWGANWSGVLGLGNTTSQTTPQLIPGLNGVVGLAGGEDHSVAVLANGTVKAWGDNSLGQLGLGAATTAVTVPTTVAGISGAMAIGAMEYRSLARLSSGTLMAWGTNGSGQCGIGTTQNVTTPQPVPSTSQTVLSASVAATTPMGTNRVWNLQHYLPVAAGELYWFDVSLYGSGPGIPLTGMGSIPLNPPLLRFNYGTLFDPFFSNAIGNLDAMGHASPALLIPAFPPLIGLSVTGAAVTLDPNNGFRVVVISNAASTLIQ